MDTGQLVKKLLPLVAHLSAFFKMFFLSRICSRYVNKLNKLSEGWQRN